MKGYLITFEGIDGCGKTTQVQELIKRIGESWPYILVREPGGTPISESIRTILLDNKHQEMYPLTELLLYAASRHQLCQEVIKPALEEGRIVLCDRFYDSTTAYQGYGRGLNLNFIRELNRLTTMGIVPDLTFIFDVSLQERELRLVGRQPDRLERDALEFQQRVCEGFRKIAAAETRRVRLIDGRGSIAAIADEVWNHFKALIME